MKEKISSSLATDQSSGSTKFGVVGPGSVCLMTLHFRLRFHWLCDMFSWLEAGLGCMPVEVSFQNILIKALQRKISRGGEPILAAHWASQDATLYTTVFVWHFPNLMLTGLLQSVYRTNAQHWHKNQENGPRQSSQGFRWVDRCMVSGWSLPF